MTITRRARLEEYEKIVDFYRDNGYRPFIKSADILIVAENEGVLCGVVRICEEHEVLTLRGMRVCKGLRKQGIGTHLLETVKSLIGKRECFCIPHRYLSTFYGRIGFMEIEENEAPLFLRERCTTYRDEYNLDVIIMCRPARTSTTTRRDHRTKRAREF